MRTGEDHFDRRAFAPVLPLRIRSSDMPQKHTVFGENKWRVGVVNFVTINREKKAKGILPNERMNHRRIVDAKF